MLEQEFLNNIAENRGIIFKIINLYTDNDEDRKDLYQEIIYQGWRSYKNFKGDSKFSTWLYRIGLNVSLTFLSRQKKRIELIEILPVNLVAEPNELSEQSEKLQRAIKTLAEIDRGLIMLHLDGYSNTEISEIAGISKVNTGVKLHRIKQSLTELLTR
jgi:RNA polymerase sigma-70 factor (ECF subfamily)